MDTAVDFLHPSLGVVRGLSSSFTCQYKGIRYATVTGRFASAIMAEQDPNGLVDATVLG